MLKILFRLDDKDNVEANQVAEASNRLGVGEFQLFQLAHDDWYGGEVDPDLLEPAFLGYMTEDNVPHYVRHYARAIIQRSDEGTLDVDADWIHRFDRGQSRSRAGWQGISKVALVVLFTAAFMGLMMYAYQPDPADTARCQFPPCPFHR